MRPDSLAAERQAEALETAIVERRRIDLERYATVGSFADSPNGSFRVWPLQLLFHNIGWYLVFEDDAIGTGVGLIRSERIDRLALRRSERGNRRSDDSHQQALARLQTLLHHSGGIYFGDDLATQLRLCNPRGRSRERELRTLRFCSQGWCFAFIREGLQRYPIEHTRLSRPQPGDTWWFHPKAPHVLEPGSPADSHPYPVELDLPSWTVATASTCAPGCLPSVPASASKPRRSSARSIKSGCKPPYLCTNRPKRAHYNVMTSRVVVHGARSGAAAAGLS